MQSAEEEGEGDEGEENSDSLLFDKEIKGKQEYKLGF